MLRSADGIVLSEGVRQNGRDLVESYYVGATHGPNRVPFCRPWLWLRVSLMKRRCAHQQLRSKNGVCRRSEGAGSRAVPCHLIGLASMAVEETSDFVRCVLSLLHSTIKMRMECAQM